MRMRPLSLSLPKDWQNFLEIPEALLLSTATRLSAATDQNGGKASCDN